MGDIIPSGKQFINPSNGHIYFLTDPLLGTSWVEAQRQARLAGGNLVTINDAGEEDWLIGNFIINRESVWIGLSDTEEEGIHKWVSGEPITYLRVAYFETKFTPGMPNVTEKFIFSSYTFSGAFSGKTNVWSFGMAADELVWIPSTEPTGEQKGLRGIVEIDCAPTLTKDQLKEILFKDLESQRDPKTKQIKPLTKADKSKIEKGIDTYLPALNKAMLEFNINTAKRQQAFIAQLAHESNRLKSNVEALYYTTPGRLMKLFNNPKKGKYLFPDLESEKPYLRNPKKLANYLYSDRKDLGNDKTKPNEGWNFRGRGLIQLTGRENYRKIGQKIGKDLENYPDLLFDPEVSARAAAGYWEEKDLNELADRGNFKEITYKINKGYAKYKEREEFYKQAKTVIKDKCPLNGSIQRSAKSVESRHEFSLGMTSSAMDNSHSLDKYQANTLHGLNSTDQSKFGACCLTRGGNSFPT